MIEWDTSIGVLASRKIPQRVHQQIEISLKRGIAGMLATPIKDRFFFGEIEFLLPDILLENKEMND
jgi:hypothetical protein